MELLSQAPPSLRSLRYFQVSWGSLFSLHTVLPQLCLPLGQMAGRPEGENGKLIASSVVLRILVFCPNPPAIICFSEHSNSCSMHCIKVLQLHSVGATGRNVLTLSCLELETQSLTFKVTFFFPAICVCSQTVFVPLG